MKVLIIGLDGLEYTLVKNLRLENLKQKEYGKTPHRDLFPICATPIIWASFITGENPARNGVTTTYRLENDSMEQIKNFFVMRGIHRIEPIYLFLMRLIKNLGLRTRPYTKEDLERSNVDTIFNYAKRSFIVNVPCYNIEAVDFELQRLLGRCFIEGSSAEDEERFERAVWRVFWERKKKCMQVLSERKDEYDLFMFYWHTPDLIGHLWGGNFIKMWRTYVRMDDLVRDLKRFVDDKTLCLVISDHGIKKVGHYGDHTNYGFYSCNFRLALKNPSIMDFKNIIQRALNEDFSF